MLTAGVVLSMSRGALLALGAGLAFAALRFAFRRRVVMGVLLLAGLFVHQWLLVAALVATGLAFSARVDMVEHVMAALAGLQIDNCEVWVDGQEMPDQTG